MISRLFVPPQHRRAAPRVRLALLVLTLAACLAAPPLPADARQALESHWQALPGRPAWRILRAWPGQTNFLNLSPADVPDKATPALTQTEVWCVTAAQTPPTGGDALETIWFIARSEPQAPWNVALLTSMSAIWPYIACGQASHP